MLRLSHGRQWKIQVTGKLLFQYLLAKDYLSMFNSNPFSFLKKSAQPDPSALGFEYVTKRSRRKSVCIQIKGGQVRVLAPMRYPNAQIAEFVEQKQAWINAKLAQQQAIEQRKSDFKNADQVLWRGENKTLVCLRASQYQLSVDDKQVTMHIPNRVNQLNLASYRKKKLALLYQQEAAEHLPTRLAQLSDITGLRPSGLTIKQYKARWGSCNNRGHINLNYLLMMTPDFVIDYVIIHELCHLKHMNHSANFWQLVALHCPDFKQAKQWLKQHNHQLNAFHD